MLLQGISADTPPSNTSQGGTELQVAFQDFSWTGAQWKRALDCQALPRDRGGPRDDFCDRRALDHLVSHFSPLFLILYSLGDTMAPYGNTPEEQAMLDALLSGLSDSVFDLTSSPLRPSQKQNVLKTPRKAASPRKQATPLEGKLNNINIDELLDGAENWDWDDMDLDFEDTKVPAIYYIVKQISDQYQPKIAPQPAQPPIPKKPKTLSTKCRVIKLEPCGEVGSKVWLVDTTASQLTRSRP
jgi:hypothetical protein